MQLSNHAWEPRRHKWGADDFLPSSFYNLSNKPITVSNFSAPWKDCMKNRDVHLEWEDDLFFSRHLSSWDRMILLPLTFLERNKETRHQAKKSQDFLKVGHKRHAYLYWLLLRQKLPLESLCRRRCPNDNFLRQQYSLLHEKGIDRRNDL